MHCLVGVFFASICASWADRPLKLCTNPTSVAGSNPNHGPNANLENLTVVVWDTVHSFRVNNGTEGSFQGEKWLKMCF